MNQKQKERIAGMIAAEVLRVIGPMVKEAALKAIDEAIK